MIDENKLIEDFMNKYRVFDDGTWNEAMDRAIELVEKAPKVGEWIPCSERLPEENQIVMCSVKKEYASHRIVLQRFDDKEYWNNGIIEAWMPLPEAYKGGEMTAKEAIKILEMFLHKQCDLERTKFDYNENQVWQAVKMASEALEKQIPKKCKVIDSECLTGYMFSEYFCANCESRLVNKDEYGWFVGKLSMNCPNCGQAIDWGKEGRNE